MEGPTPVSALIHAATMVTAGVYLMVRINPLLAARADWLPTTIAWIGAITALFAATIAVAQNDIKKVLAYSTVSQLGYMFLAVGSGAYVAAIFHMITHAFFKALLFLGSGSVIHGMHDEQDMRRMGALRKLLPITAVTFIVGWLAIAGVPPFAGFWSKDEILRRSLGQEPALWVVGFVTALLTAYYMTRQVIMVFFGEARWEDHAEEHGAPRRVQAPRVAAVMLVPLVVLAVLSTVGGLHQPAASAIRRWHASSSWLEPVVEFGEAESSAPGPTTTAACWWSSPSSVALAGIVVAYLVYQRSTGSRPIEPEILAHGWYYDEAVTAFMGGPGTRRSRRRRGSTATSSTARSTASATSVHGGCRRAAQARRPATCATTPAVIGVGVGRCCSAWFLVKGLVSGRAVMARSPVPLLTAIVLLPVVGAVVVALIPHAPARAACELVGLRLRRRAPAR